MDTILVLETIVGSLAEFKIIITIKADQADLHRLLIFLHVLLHLWEPVLITIVTVIVTVIDITEAKGARVGEPEFMIMIVLFKGT